MCQLWTSFHFNSVTPCRLDFLSQLNTVVTFLRNWEKKRRRKKEISKKFAKVFYLFSFGCVVERCATSSQDPGHGFKSRWEPGILPQNHLRTGHRPFYLIPQPPLVHQWDRVPDWQGPRIQAIMYWVFCSTGVPVLHWPKVCKFHNSVLGSFKHSSQCGHRSLKKSTSFYLNIQWV